MGAKADAIPDVTTAYSTALDLLRACYVDNGELALDLCTTIVEALKKYPTFKKDCSRSEKRRQLRVILTVCGGIALLGELSRD